MKFFIAMNDGADLMVEKETKEEVRSFVRNNFLSDKDKLPKKKDIFIIKGQKLKFNFSFDCSLVDDD
jgi:hypothetical protein